jgi:hypothetical protein
MRCVQLERNAGHPGLLGKRPELGDLLLHTSIGTIAYPRCHGSRSRRPLRHRQSELRVSLVPVLTRPDRVLALPLLTLLLPFSLPPPLLGLLLLPPTPVLVARASYLGEHPRTERPNDTDQRNDQHDPCRLHDTLCVSPTSGRCPANSGAAVGL